MSSNIFDSIQISYFDNCRNSTPLKNISVTEAVNCIKAEIFKDKINAIRQARENGELNKYQNLKSSLPAITFGGMFSPTRNAINCKLYSKLLVVDIDDLDAVSLEHTFAALKEDRYVVALWISPSGNGIKCLVSINVDKDIIGEELCSFHKSFFKKVYKYMLQEHGIEIDKSGSDISRLCYFSSDGNLIVKNCFDMFSIYEDEICNFNQKKENIQKNMSSFVGIDWKHLPANTMRYPKHRLYKNRLNNIYLKLKKHNLSITSSYFDWVKVAFTIASNIHPNIGRDLFMKICELDGENHDAVKSEKLIFSAYIKTHYKVRFQTIEDLARQAGIWNNL